MGVLRSERVVERWDILDFVAHLFRYRDLLRFFFGLHAGVGCFFRVGGLRGRCTLGALWVLPSSKCSLFRIFFSVVTVDRPSGVPSDIAVNCVSSFSSSSLHVVTFCDSSSGSSRWVVWFFLLSFIFNVCIVQWSAWFFSIFSSFFRFPFHTPRCVYTSCKLVTIVGGFSNCRLQLFSLFYRRCILNGTKG